MNSKTKKILLMSSLSFLVVGTAAVALGVTIAGYERRQIIMDPTQSSEKLEVTGEGTRLSSYYLDIGIWGTIDNTGYSFWALVFVYNGSTPTSLKYYKGTLDGNNYRYTFSKGSYDRIKFFRTASSNDSTLTNSTTYSHSYYTSGGGYATDGTAELEFDSECITYQITGWHGDFIDAVGFWR